MGSAGERLAQLIVVEGPDRGKNFVVARCVVIGSGDDADVQLADRRASQKQAQVSSDDEGRYEIRTLDPRRNLMVNGEVVRQRRLAHGDWITLADTTLVFSDERPLEQREFAVQSIEAADLLASSIGGRRRNFDNAAAVHESVDDTCVSGQLERARDRLGILYRVATAVASQLDLTRLLEVILDLCFEVFPADAGVVLLMDEEERKLRPMAARARGSAGTSEPASHVQVEKTMVREVFKRREALLSTDLGAGSDFDAASTPSSDFSSVLCAPMVFEDQVVGVVQLATNSPLRKFTRGDVDLLSAVAMQCATAIQNARAYKRRREYSRNLIYLARAMQKLSSYLDRNKICREAVKAACSLLHCTKGSLLLKRSDQGQSSLRLVYAIGMSRSLASNLSRQHVGLRFAHQVVQTGKVMLVTDVGELPEEFEPYADDANRYMSKSFIIVPVTAPTVGDAKGYPIGALCVADKLSGATFTGNDQELLQILASQAGTALTNAELYEKATIDTLTGVYVRRHFLQQLELAVRDAHLRKEPLCLLLVDLDHFKSVNDDYGHPVGDAVLRAFGKLMKRAVREDMECGRYGGEEFGVLCRGMEESVAERIAERLRAAVDEHPFRISGGRTLHRTASLGVALLLPGESADSLIERADRAMYLAKNGGRNRVVVADASPVESVAPVDDRGPHDLGGWREASRGLV